ncbi:hypothetical protein [Spirosoma utsteinense]|uniref:hypothetical protein n=1 Tax=Spirosoma utsteinense TaxID=2585773 RepID=UPI001646FCC7|nr:hypothetical protein [Spirosoma utsteinense]MBC3785738.1 hypothetical protein [Spirosoma utsteinense]
MTINAKVLSLALTGVSVGLVYFLAQQCSTTADYRQANTDLVNDTLRLHSQSSDFARLYAQCEKKAAEARSYASNLTEKLNQSVASVGKTVQSLTQREQRAAVVRDLVANQSLPASRLRDTVFVPGPVQADSELVAAVAKTTKWLGIYKGQRDSLLVAVGSYDAEVSELEKNLGEKDNRIAAARDALLSEAERARLLGIGRRKAMRKLAREVGTTSPDR